ALDGNARYARLDPYAGAQLNLAEAYRNVAVSGAKPLAVTNCLNFGSPEDPGVMWQFAEATRGLADACQALGTPVTGGNVSFYNQTGSTAINPTPVIGVLGVIDDVHKRVTSAFSAEGESVVFLLGETRLELGGSAWADVIHGHLGGRPPQIDLDAEAALGRVLIDGAAAELLVSAHDLSDGGLAVALAESCLRGGVGCEVDLGDDAFTALFSESAARAVVSVRPEHETALVDLCAKHGVPVRRLGTVGGSALTMVHRTGRISIEVAELRDAYESTLPALFGNK
ncbi:MAG: AIR synthase related protein, partial [Thermobifida fusca]|nr:AIR synthase related protein [Thermobifida fusca]